MKCARLHLQERNRCHGPPAPSSRPRRFCQQRMVDPCHDSDPRWTELLLERFQCDRDESEQYGTHRNNDNMEDLYLSVQTLKFQGEEQRHQRPKTCYKFRSHSNGNHHRMFVKQAVEGSEELDVDQQSQHTDDYFDHYVKYILNADRCSTSSVNSSLCLYGKTAQFKINKAVQVDTNHKRSKPKPSTNVEQVKVNENTPIKDANISYHRSENRHSITISRNQSPETVQVIRVDVSYNCKNNTSKDNNEEVACEKKGSIENGACKQLTNKYLLTKSLKSLEQRVPGAKVTLLCKTFRLADRTHGLRMKDNQPVNSNLQIT